MLRSAHATRRVMSLLLVSGAGLLKKHPRTISLALGALRLCPPLERRILTILQARGVALSYKIRRSRAFVWNLDIDPGLQGKWQILLTQADKGDHGK